MGKTQSGSPTWAGVIVAMSVFFICAMLLLKVVGDKRMETHAAQIHARSVEKREIDLVYRQLDLIVVALGQLREQVGAIDGTGPDGVEFSGLLTKHGMGI